MKQNGFAIKYGQSYEIKTDCFNKQLEFAACELKKYLTKMANADACGGGLKILLGFGEKFITENGLHAESLRYDGFIISARGSLLVLASLKPRGVLFAVYEFLKTNGCKFVRAACTYEKIPSFKTLRFDGTVCFNPDFKERTLANVSSVMNEEWQRETVDFVDWCAKNYINTIFLHQSVQTPIDGYNRRVYDEIEKRGLNFEFGGHSAELYIPRGYFDSQPERFIFKDGKRVPQGNFCVTNDDNIRLLTDGIVGYLKNNPHIDVLHLWFDDVMDGSWCCCEKCATMTPSEQQMYVVKCTAANIERQFPNVKLDMLLYHDTLENLEKLEKPASNVTVLFAPRERCYGHSLNDQDCKLNGEMRGILDVAIKNFRAENICIFDYYMDVILFSKIKVLLPGVIAADLSYYLSRGIRKVCSLSFGQYSYWAYDLNFYVYAKHSFHAGAALSETLAQYITDMGFPEEFKRYADMLEEITKNYFAFCGYRADWYYDIRGLKLCEYFGEHIKKIEKAVSMLKTAEELLDMLADCATPDTAGYFSNEKTLLQLTRMEAGGILERMSVRFKNYTERPEDKSALVNEFEKIKSMLYGMIDIMDHVDEKVKGVQGGALFREHLCKDQIWTLNELMSLEMGLNVNMDRSTI